MKIKKNGQIEFQRFVFCIAILLFHIEKYIMGEPSLNEGIHVSLFAHGSLGVEFFFLTSGFFMARTAKKQQEIIGAESAAEYRRFIIRKYQRIFPMHAIAYGITFLCFVIVNNMSAKECSVLLLKNVPSFFLVQMSGLGISSVNHIEWYISSMLIAMAVLYPVFINYYRQFLHYGGGSFVF